MHESVRCEGWRKPRLWVWRVRVWVLLVMRSERREGDRSRSVVEEKRRRGDAAAEHFIVLHSTIRQIEVFRHRLYHEREKWRSRATTGFTQMRVVSVIYLYIYPATRLNDKVGNAWSFVNDFATKRTTSTFPANAVKQTRILLVTWRTWQWPPCK